MNENIKISILNYDRYDDLIEFKILVANQLAASSLEFYGYDDTFNEFAQRLTSFPKTISDIVEFEIGSEDVTSAYHLFIKVFCYEVNGDSAIQVKVHNHQKLPETHACELYIKAKPASINQLGLLLLNWNPQTEDHVSWSSS